MPHDDATWSIHIISDQLLVSTPMSFYSVNSVADSLSLNGDELDRNRQLVQIIRNAIRAKECRAITFAEFMDLALYHLNLGYYTSATQILGEDGDFTTAPELGNLFGKILASKIASIFSRGETCARIYEFGAGSGKLAVQILNELSRLGIDIEEYSIIETSPRLKSEQQNLINRSQRQFKSNVSWLDDLPQNGMQGVAIANEVLDAIPVDLIRIVNRAVLRGYVVESGNGFELEFKECHEDLFVRTVELVDMPECDSGYTTELHCRAEAWLRTIGEVLTAGSILISDYGFPNHEYYHRDRSEGTLICHRRHHSLYDPFSFIGCQDITAHLNFSLLAKVAEESGMNVNGFTTLAGFIIDVGAAGMEQTNATASEQRNIAQQMNILTSSSEMGELFKVMELTKNFESSQLGFRTLDHTHRL